MKSFFTIIKNDYLQRTRSYAFLITLCASLAIGYTFVPEPNANYSTIRIAGYIGYYNSAWFGYVTAIMTSVFLSLIGFYLVNSGIKQDIHTKVGQIVASTRIKNGVYLLSKVLSNFLVLITIVALVFCMSLVLFFLYNDGYSLEIFQFIKPYLIITIPAMFVVSAVAVVFEVLLGKHSIIQNIGFFFLFSFLMIPEAKTEAEFATDVFGSKIVIHQLENSVQNILNIDDTSEMTIGYVLGNVTKAKKFEFNGVNFPMSFILSRFLWIVLGIISIILLAPLFHRFNTKEKSRIQKKNTVTKFSRAQKNIELKHLPKTVFNNGILPLIKSEMLMLYRNGKRWLWIFNILGMVLLGILNLEIAHTIVLPILWFFQVARLSEISTKELTNNVHYFTFTSNKPLRRLLISQVVSGIILSLLLASPLIIRFLMQIDIMAFISVILGGVFIVVLAFVLGMLTRGKKLFEVLFFMITYANINGIPFLDYFGAQSHNGYYLVMLSFFIIALTVLCFSIRKFQLKNM